MKSRKKADANNTGEANEQAEQSALAVESTAENGQTENNLPAVTTDGKDGVVVEGKVITKKERNLRTARRWFLMTAGIIMMSASVYFFQNPNRFTLGGIAGIAIVLSQIINVEFLSYDVVLIILNVLLLIVGLIVLGKQCTVRTIYCALLYTGLIMLFEYVDVIGLIVPEGQTTLTNEPFLELCYAILLFGVAGALVFNCGASSGGTDIIALILKKYTKMNVGIALMIIDFIVVCISFYTFIDLGVQVGLFSLLGLFTKSFLLDGVIENMTKTKYITVVTTMPDEIGEYILKVVKHSYTMYDAEGGYTREKKKVLVTVCKRSEALKIKVKVKQADPHAFVIITNANEIIGKGFGGTF